MNFVLKILIMEAVVYNSSLYSEAQNLERGKKFDEAISLYEFLIDKDDANVGLFIRLGELYESIQLKEKAINTYKKGILYAQKLRNTKAERYISHMLLGLID